MSRGLSQQILAHLASGPLVLHAGAEVAPYSKRGGLGDVLQSLPLGLARRGFASAVISPYYAHLAGRFCRVLSGVVRFHGVESCYHLYGEISGGVCYLFVEVEAAYSFDRIYQDGLLPYVSEVNLSYFLFGKAVAEIIGQLNVSCVVMTHDWHVGAIYPYLEPRRRRCATVHVIHNYHYQGEIFPDILEVAESDVGPYISRIFEAQGVCSLSAMAVCGADHLVTVSPSYAEELTSGRAPHPYVRLLRGKTVTGILNGIHSECWNPATDLHLVRPYDSAALEAKADNKRNLIGRLGLSATSGTPVLLMLSRLTNQKGIDLLIDLKNGPEFDPAKRAASILDLDAVLIVCGTPQGGLDGPVHAQFAALADRFPGRICYIPAYTEELAHQLLAGADILLHPSRFEPCGLTQLHALAYGTIPVVTKVGGLRDTVPCVLADPEQGVGFQMGRYHFSEFLRVISLALDHYRQRDEWQGLIRRAMAQEHGWDQRITPYVKMLNDAFRRLEEGCAIV